MAKSKDRQQGVYSIEDSLAPYSVKWKMPPEVSQISAVSDFRIAVRIALAREDDVCNRRQGGQGMIFFHPWIAHTSLPDARAGAAVFYDAFSEYCAANNLEPLDTLIRNGTPELEAKSFLEYAGAMRSMINQALERQR